MTRETLGRGLEVKGVVTGSVRELGPEGTGKLRLLENFGTGGNTRLSGRPSLGTAPYTFRVTTTPSFISRALSWTRREPLLASTTFALAPSETVGRGTGTSKW